MDEAKIEFTVGLFLWGRVRDILDAAQFENRKIRWRESSGWIERRYTVIGPPNEIAALQRKLGHWFSTLGQMGSM